MTLTEIAEQVERSRRAQGLTQRELAGKMHVARVSYAQWINKIRHGKQTLMVCTLIRMLDAVGLELCVRPAGTVDHIHEHCEFIRPSQERTPIADPTDQLLRPMAAIPMREEEG